MLSMPGSSPSVKLQAITTNNRVRKQHPRQQHRQQQPLRKPSDSSLQKAARTFQTQARSVPSRVEAILDKTSGENCSLHEAFLNLTITRARSPGKLTKAPAKPVTVRVVFADLCGESITPNRASKAKHCTRDRRRKHEREFESATRT